ncbi:MAG: hypothetical protein U0670_09950 [Anaerolineae bacterium]
MIQRLTGQLPTWARPTHPILRHELGQRGGRPRWQVRYTRAFMIIGLIAVLALIGVLTATGVGTHAAGQNIVESTNALLYYPLIIVQLVARIAAFLLTVETVGQQQRSGTWDHLRATEKGAELTLRARWATVFYRMRGLLGGITLLRIVLLGLMLYDLTSFQGRHLDLFIVGITPDVPLVLAVLLLSFMMTAGLLLPFTGVGLDASLGLLVSSHVQQRVYSVLIQVMFILVRVIVVGALLLAASTYLGGGLDLSSGVSWVLLFAFAAVGDWGLAFLYLGRFGEVWAIVPYGILIGLALMIFAFVQAGLADAILGLAARRAQHRG